ncbi:hypothetical protein K438DRAFT_1885388 [Mycena galopus ATCC 62051]|nr:hypothetical protein K438DRAFT_1898108 [Mycena galopus ATCC 62051]KAF8131730.1 hypothetical protein K438DRAFT_1885388 [Mycena galopus ATCC 62051]
MTIPATPTSSDPATSTSQPTAPSDGIDRSEWSPNFREVYAYLSQKNWGEGWKKILAALIYYEWSHFFEDDIDKIVRIRCRPSEIGQWMKKHRAIGDFVLDPKLPPFGERLLEWWKEVGPQGRWDLVGTREEPKTEQNFARCEWSHAGRFGRNGIQLFILALAWWGQDIWNHGASDGLGGSEKALGEAADWQRLVRDIGWFLGFG